MQSFHLFLHLLFPEKNESIRFISCFLRSAAKIEVRAAPARQKLILIPVFGEWRYNKEGAWTHAILFLFTFERRGGWFVQNHWVI